MVLNGMLLQRKADTAVVVVVDVLSQVAARADPIAGIVARLLRR